MLVFFLLAREVLSHQGYNFLPWDFAVSIYRENLPQEFAVGTLAVGICQRNLPRIFAAGICRRELPQELTVAICKWFFVFVSKYFFYMWANFVYMEANSFYMWAKPSYLWDFIYWQCFFLLLSWQLWATVLKYCKVRFEIKFIKLRCNKWSLPMSI